MLVYSQGAGRAAALVHHGDGTLEVVAVLGMRWQPGKLVSERTLRGLRPLGEGLPSALTGEWPGAVVAQAMVDDP